MAFDVGARAAPLDGVQEGRDDPFTPEIPAHIATAYGSTRSAIEDVFGIRGAFASASSLRSAYSNQDEEELVRAADAEAHVAYTTQRSSKPKAHKQKRSVRMHACMHAL